MAVFAGPGLGAGASTSPVSALLLIVGVLIGSAAWWLLLSAAVDRLRGRFREGGLIWVNRGSGAVITAFGLIAILSLRP